MNAVTIDPEGWAAVGEAQLPEAIKLRRAIHAEPELGLDLPKTTAKVKAALAGLPLEIREGPSTSGVVAILRGPANGRTVLLRGDMDALPLTEDTGLAVHLAAPKAPCTPAATTPTSRCWPAPRGRCASGATALPAR